MPGTRMGRATVGLPRGAAVEAWSATAAQKEAEGPLGGYFDRVLSEDLMGEKTWEMAEARMSMETVRRCLEKARLQPDQVDALLGGDLINQLMVTNLAARDLGMPFLGLYNACATMAEALAAGAMLVEGGCMGRVVAAASSHFSSAERQYRAPLEMGGQRTPSSQWTVTGAGAMLLTAPDLMETKPAAYVRCVTLGRVVDLGVRDTTNMGAAMAPAAAETLQQHFTDTNRTPADYDLILTGDLGRVGLSLLHELMAERGMPLDPERTSDCGVRIFSEAQEVEAGGSGCGCSASVLCSEIMGLFAEKKLHRVALMATGALLNSISVFQGETIPSIAHLVVLEAE